MQAMTFNEITQNLAGVMDKVNEDHEPMIVTHDQHKPVVIMSLDDFNAWQETAYLTRSKANAEDLLAAVEEIRTRKNLAHHELIDTP